MKVAIIQSNYIPWRGYFDIIDDVDLFIYHDDIQYTKNDWRNRNRIMTAAGAKWLTVPVKYKRVDQRICDTQIDYSQNWIDKHVNQISINYRKSPHFDFVFEEYGRILMSKYTTISDLNVHMNAMIMAKLGIRTKVTMSSTYLPTGSKTDRLIDILSKAGATSYLSGSAAKAYIDTERFRKANIRLEYKAYEYKPYPQLYAGFEPKLTVLDMLFNCGEDSRDNLKSTGFNELAARTEHYA